MLCGIHVTALLALSALALPASNAFAQIIFAPGMNGVGDRSNPGRATEANVPMCQATAGGSRMRPNCELETTTATFETEQTLKILLEAPTLPDAQCGATTTTEYRQLNTVARVNGTLAITDCAAASGAFTVALRISDDSGEDKPLEFSETWQRSDDQDVEFTADYPIGENVELISARIRGLRCTCADPAKEDSEVREPAVGSPPAIAENPGN